MARYLVVAHLTAGSPELQRQIRRMVERDPEGEFTLLVPTSPPTHRLVWNDAEAMRSARERADAAGAALTAAGANVVRTAVGARDPLSAIDDEVREQGPYDELLICTLPVGISRWLNLDLISRARQHTKLPVTHVVAKQEWLMGPVGGLPATLEAPPAESGRDEPEVAPPREPAQSIRELVAGAQGGDTIGQAVAVFEEAVRTNAGLEPVLAALVRLRVAHLQHCPYTWQEAVAIARGMGIADERITALEHFWASEHVPFDDLERAALRYVDAVFKGHGSETARRVLASEANAQTIAAITMLAGLTRALGDLAIAHGLTPTGRFVGWDLYVGESTATL